MSSSTWMQMCVHHRSGINSHIYRLADGIGSAFRRSVRLIHPFAREHMRCTHITGHHPQGHKALTVTFTVSKQADLIDSLYLENHWPALKAPPDISSTGTMTASSKYGGAMYAYGLAYAWWQSLHIKVGNQTVVAVPSDFMEAVEELRRPEGQRLREQVFKFKDTTWNNLIERSSRPVVTFTNIDCWFTRTRGQSVAISALGKSPFEVVVKTRDMKQFTHVLPLMDGSKIETDDVLPYTVNENTELNWGSEGLEVNLLVGHVYIPDKEAAWFGENVHEYPVTFMQSPNSVNDDEGMPFPANSDTLKIEQGHLEFPVRSMIWTICDEQRGSLNTTAGASDGKPYSRGVRALYGKPCGESDYNVLEDGCSITPVPVQNTPVTYTAPEAVTFAVPKYTDNGDLEVNDAGELQTETHTISFADATGTFSPTSLGSKVTSAGIKKYNADTGEGPYLPGNRYDYRLANESGMEVEPLKQFTLRLNNKNRLEETLPGCYFRMIQNCEHWKGVVRKGIYTMNFGLDSASSTVLSMALNLSQIENKNFTFVSNVVSGSTSGINLRLNLWMEHYQILVQENGVISDIYAN